MLLGVVFVAFQTVVVADEVALDPVLSEQVQFYDGMLFGVLEKDQLIKQNLKGQAVWGVSFKGAIKQVQFRFGKAIVLSDDGRLTCLDLMYGYQEWEVLDFPVSEFFVSYPFISFVAADGTAGVISFQSGQLEWSRQIPGVKGLQQMGHSGVLAGVIGAELCILGLTTGEELGRYSLPDEKASLLKTFNEGGVLSHLSTYWVFNLKTKEFKRYRFNGDPMAWVQETFYVYYDELERLIVKVDAVTQEQVWEIQLEKQPVSFFDSAHFMVVANQKSPSMLIDLRKGSADTLDLQEVDIGQVRHMYYRAEQGVYFVTTSTLVQVPL